MAQRAGGNKEDISTHTRRERLHDRITGVRRATDPRRLFCVPSSWNTVPSGATITAVADDATGTMAAPVALVFTSAGRPGSHDHQ